MTPDRRISARPRAATPTRRGRITRPSRHTGAPPSFEPAVTLLPSAEPRVAPTFTVFTPTRNRAHTLHRVYDSLIAQTLTDFEWLVIDNESSDDTADVIAHWQATAPFPIRYIRQVNRGLTVSWNRAVAEAHGEFLVTLASDDTCYPNALERLQALWATIPEDRRHEFSGVATLCVDEHGRLIGNPFPSSPLDASSLEMRYRFHVRGEKWGCQRLDVMRQFPFPVIEGYVGYVPEGLVWNAIGRRYKERCVNEVLRAFWLDAPVSLARPRFAGDNALGGLMRAEDLLVHDIRFLRHAPAEFLKAAMRYSRFSFHLRRGIADQWRRLPTRRARSLWLAMLPVGAARFAWDLRRRGEQRPTGTPVDPMS
jgi:glycosyltransferase involved in cell wall biosynthesis